LRVPVVKMCVATLLVLLLAMTGCGGPGDSTTLTQTRPGVSFLDYSPKPFSKDMIAMTVRFTTTGPATRDDLSDRRYFVWVFTGKDNRDERCYDEFSSDEGVLGEPGKTYVQVIQMTFQDSERDGPVPEAHACFGRAQLVVWTGDNGGCCSPRKVMRTRDEAGA
jgi:hypothetical protein